MAGLTLPKLFTAGVLSLGFVSVALAQDPPEPEEAQTYLISDFDGNGTAIDDQGVTVAFAFANNWEWDYGYSHSTIANETNEKGEYIALVDDGSGSNQVLGFYGLSAEGDGEPAGYSLGLRVPNHLAGCQVVSYRYKGASHKIKFLMEGNPTADNNHFYWSNASKNWTTVVFRTSSMEQDYGWGNEVDLNVDDVYEIQWEKPGSEYDLNYLYVDDVQCVDPPVYTVNFYHGDDLLYSEKFLEGQMPQISKYFDDFSTDA